MNSAQVALIVGGVIVLAGVAAIAIALGWVSLTFSLRVIPPRARRAQAPAPKAIPNGNRHDHRGSDGRFIQQIHAGDGRRAS
ncbi:MAG: hypothetical protein J2P30_01685 [Actinobacteria bacterium]|nr:hypothetical protein [Actinomycetota bacterium]